MSIDKRDEIIQNLCYDLSDEELYRLLVTIQDKRDKGYSPDQIALQLITAIAEAVALAAPEMDDEEILDLADEIGDAIIDRVIEFTGGTVENIKEEVPPHEQLN